MTSCTRYTQDEQGQWWYVLKGERRTKAKVWRCRRCGKEFPAYTTGGRIQLFCSRECRALAERKPRPRRQYVCKQCGQAFRPTSGSQKYCSKSCASTWMQAHKPATTTLADVSVVGADNPHFSQDDAGQWWYKAGRAARTRAYVETCIRCGRRVLRSIFHTSKYCTRQCAIRAIYAAGAGPGKGENNHHWKGGRQISRGGYVLVWCPDHPSRMSGRKYVLEHRLVMEQYLGRYLRSDEHVHHKNGQRDDNRLENLELWTTAHPPGVKVGDSVRHCPTCTCPEHGMEMPQTNPKVIIVTPRTGGLGVGPAVGSPPPAKPKGR